MQGTAMPSLAAGTYLHCVRQMALALWQPRYVHTFTCKKQFCELSTGLFVL
jgi:hypothetical protein